MISGSAGTGPIASTLHTLCTRKKELVNALEQTLAAATPLIRDARDISLNLDLMIMNKVLSLPERETAFIQGGRKLEALLDGLQATDRMRAVRFSYAAIGEVIAGLEALADNSEIESLVLEGLESGALGGEVKALAANISATWSENPKHFESFREGAVQSLIPFGLSGHLAASMQSCGFRFRDLKRKKATLFLVCDYSRMDDFAPWAELIVWAAKRELIREDNRIPVHFILDEFTNFRLVGLANDLTALRGNGIHIWLLVQELQEIVRVYGREALATILSQSDVKMFLAFPHQKQLSLSAIFWAIRTYMGKALISATRCCRLPA